MTKQVPSTLGDIAETSTIANIITFTGTIGGGVLGYQHAKNGDGAEKLLWTTGGAVAGGVAGAIVSVLLFGL